MTCGDTEIMKNMWFLRKNIWVYGGIVLVVAGLSGFWVVRNRESGVGTLIVHKGDFLQQVSVSGKVVAAESVDLVFSQTGRVSHIYADVGNTVLQGTVLASIENGDLYADTLQKEATYEAIGARLKLLQAGTRPEQLAVTQSSVTNAEASYAQSNQAIIDAIRNAYTQSDDAVYRRVDQFVSDPRSPQPKLNFLTSSQLQQEVEWQRLILGPVLVSWKTSVDALDSAGDPTLVVESTTKNLGKMRIFLDKVATAVNSLTQTSSLSQAVIDGYRADVAAARVNINTAETALTSAVTAQKNTVAILITAKRNLELEEAGTTDEEIAAQASQVKAAGADLESARAKLQKTLMAAPFTGIVTKMDAKVGGSAGANVPLISMISADTFQIESFVPEINVALLKVGDGAAVTLDAYGADVVFPATVVSIDPAETIRDGVVNFRVKAIFEKSDPRFKSGLTANLRIQIERKENALALPQSAIIERDGGLFVQKETGSKTEDARVETGIRAGDGFVEILSGVNEGDRVINAGRKKTQ